MSNQRICELTTSSVPIKATDFVEVSVYNGATYDSRKVNSEYLKPYKVYTALMGQIGTGAPTATVLENTIGSIVWTRTSGGNYKGTLTGAFTSAKTVGFLTLNYIGDDNTVQCGRVSNNEFNITTLNSLSTPTDTVLSDASLEIRVYQ
jgi:hypothetical protein